jgi:5-methylcytosine-specific restriction endonuclease McrA
MADTNLPEDKAAAKKAQRREYNKRYREQNREKLNAYLVEWRKTHTTNRSEASKEKSKARMRERYATDPEYRERLKTAVAEYRAANPEKIKKSEKKWKTENIDTVRRYHREYSLRRWHEDPEFHKRSLIAKSVWRIRNWAALTEGQGWIHQINDQPIDKSLLNRLHAWQQGYCYICNRKSANLTIEHIIPRSRGGPTTKNNLVLSCPSCNYTRQAKILNVEWFPETIEKQPNGLTLTSNSIFRYLLLEELNPTAVDGGFSISGPLAKKTVYIISTFLGSERNPGSGAGRQAAWLIKDNPNAITLFDYEWFMHRDAVINMLKSKIGLAHKSFGARQLMIIEPNIQQNKEFLEKNHVLSVVNGTHRIALSTEDTIYGLAVFNDLGDHYECSRLCFRGHVPGGASRLIEYLWKTYQRKPIITFIDSRYASGSGNESINFERIAISSETYLWVFPDKVQHQRFLSDDDKISRSLIYFNPDLSNEVNIKANGVHKIWIPPKLKMILKP